jgi:hypothetical protein
VGTSSVRSDVPSQRVYTVNLDALPNGLSVGAAESSLNPREIDLSPEFKDLVELSHIPL